MCGVLGGFSGVLPSSQCMWTVAGVSFDIRESSLLAYVVRKDKLDKGSKKLGGGQESHYMDCEGIGGSFKSSCVAVGGGGDLLGCNITGVRFYM